MEDFEAAISKGNVLVYFWSTHCVGCKVLSPIIDEITEITVVKVNTGESKSIASRYGITGLPYLLLFKDGHPYTTIARVNSKREILEAIEKAG